MVDQLSAVALFIDYAFCSHLSSISSTLKMYSIQLHKLCASLADFKLLIVAIRSFRLLNFLLLAIPASSNNSMTKLLRFHGIKTKKSDTRKNKVTRLMFIDWISQNFKNGLNQCFVRTKLWKKDTFSCTKMKMSKTNATLSKDPMLSIISTLTTSPQNIFIWVFHSS